MAVNSVLASKTTVGATQVQVSAYNTDKEYTMVAADKANTLTIYVDGNTGVSAASGFGELAAGQVLSIPGAAAVYAISTGAAQAVRVLEGLK